MLCFVGTVYPSGALKTTPGIVVRVVLRQSLVYFLCFVGTVYPSGALKTTPGIVVRVVLRQS
jgi:hypothetical protein